MSGNDTLTHTPTHTPTPAHTPTHRDYYEQSSTSLAPVSSKSRESTQTTMVVTQPKEGGVRNELSLRLRDTSWTISGWKACAVETLSLGLMVAGIIFVGMHGRDAVSSIGSAVSGAMKK